MRTNERGIGNFPFIAVLVLFVISLVLFFMARDEADSAQTAAKNKDVQITQKNAALGAARAAYDAAMVAWGFAIPELNAGGSGQDTYPDPKLIEDKIRERLAQFAGDIERQSETEIDNRIYEFPTDGSKVGYTKGEPNKLKLYAVSHAKETITVQALLSPMAAQFAFAAKTIRENNTKFETEAATYAQARTALKGQIDKNKSDFDTKISQVTSTLDTATTEKTDLQDQVNKLSAANDDINSKNSTIKADAQKRERKLNRDKQALTDALRNLRRLNEVALATDPKDSEVLVSNAAGGICYIQLGRRNHLMTGTIFEAWRAGKGAQRENIAKIRVLEVYETFSKCRILQTYDSRVPVAKGMNVSNPFYDPARKLRVFIYGDLSRYSTDIARRRLADAGAEIARSVDERVNVIVVGTPSVGGSDDAQPEDEAEAAAAERRADAERAKRLNEIITRARAIGAVVVSENVLATFITY